MADEKKRREKGEGSIFQRENRTWVAKYKGKCLYGKSELEVRKKLKKYKEEFNPSAIKKQTIKQYMDNWKINTKQNELKPTSYERLLTTLEHQVYPHIGDLQIDNVTSKDIEEMINSLIKKGLSYSSIKKAYEAINSCFKNGVIKRHFIVNPVLGVSLPKKLMNEAKDIHYFEEIDRGKICEEAVRKYKNGTSVYRLGYGIILIMYTGMRIGEALALKWCNVDIQNKVIAIKGNMVVSVNREDNKKKYVMLDQNTAKTKAGERTIPLTQKAINALEELYKITSGYEKVFSTKAGKNVSPRNIDRMFRNILTVCEIPLQGVHSLRHTFASMMFKKGVDVKTVSELLGHSDVYITYNTYIHLINEQKRQAIELIDD